MGTLTHISPRGAGKFYLLTPASDPGLTPQFRGALVATV
jgi:hypothetical protein